MELLSDVFYKKLVFDSLFSSTFFHNYNFLIIDVHSSHNSGGICIFLAKKIQFLLLPLKHHTFLFLVDDNGRENLRWISFVPL